MNITKKLMLAAGLVFQLSGSLHADEWSEAVNVFGGVGKIKPQSMTYAQAKAKAAQAGNTKEAQAIAAYVSRESNSITKKAFKDGLSLVSSVESHINPAATNNAAVDSSSSAAATSTQMNPLYESITDSGMSPASGPADRPLNSDSTSGASVATAATSYHSSNENFNQTPFNSATSYHNANVSASGTAGASSNVSLNSDANPASGAASAAAASASSNEAATPTRLHSTSSNVSSHSLVSPASAAATLASAASAAATAVPASKPSNYVLLAEQAAQSLADAVTVVPGNEKAEVVSAIKKALKFE